MTYRELLNRNRDLSDARTLLIGLMGWTLTEYALHVDDEVSPEVEKRFSKAADRRRNRVPLQYLTGTAPFFGRDFFVTEDVLIPRFDTEILVEKALEEMKTVEGGKMLDLCTGSGCIAVTMALEHPTWKVFASDVSEAALKVAEKNAKTYQAPVRFIECDLFSGIEDAFSLIVTNPPYIPDPVIETLDEEVKDHEPHLALSGGEDGLSIYRRLIPEALRHLIPGGKLMTEIGFDQAEEVVALMKEAGFTDVSVSKDLAGLDRVVTGSMKNVQSIE